MRYIKITIKQCNNGKMFNLIRKRTTTVSHRLGLEDCTIPAREIYLYQEVTSTNDIARKMAKCGAAEGTIVMSETQTAGRGRLTRQWSCPAGKGLLMSMVVRPKILARNVPLLSLLAGVVVAETIKTVTGCQAGLKWPNDVLINGKKVCGILAESSISYGNPEYVIIGIGINLNLDITDLPADCRNTSTSIKAETGKKVSRLDMLRQFIIIWDEYYQAYLREGYLFVLDKWINNNITLERTVTVNKEREAISGQAVGISKRGGLLVILPDGEFEEYLAGDVSLGKNFYEGCFKSIAL
ncbi:MAG TPA: biotin--[acetyl-CoA-carboxylase] ligase [Syntrophomonadaceae bacterium]|nr:biotin--[acetyl-CoA-carboxylase] ligase [Syntrophomonadaceae bacterium]